jgi:hypothetical protein
MIINSNNQRDANDDFNIAKQPTARKAVPTPDNKPRWPGATLSGKSASASPAKPTKWAILSSDSRTTAHNEKPGKIGTSGRGLVKRLVASIARPFNQSSTTAK